MTTAVRRLALRSLLPSVFLVACVACSPTPALAFHFPWDQGHDTFKPVPPLPPNDPCAKDGSKPECDPCKKTACPVFLNTGNATLRSIDLAFRGFGPALQVGRTYNSQDRYNGIFGRGWIFDYSIMAIAATDGIQEVIILRQPNGERMRYTRAADGSYTGPPQDEGVLVQNMDGTVRYVRREGTIFDFSSDGLLQSVSSSNGRSVRLTYGAGCLQALSDDAGRTISFVFGPNGRVSSITDFAGRTVSYAYDANGNLTSWVDPDGNVTRYSYNSGGKLTEVEGPRRHDTITYDSLDRVSTVSDESGSFRFFFDSTTSVRKVDQQSGAVWTYTLDPATGYITQVRHPNGSTSSATYDANGRLTSSTRRSGAQYLYTYDANGNNTSTAGPFGELTTSEYSPDGRDLLKLNQNGLVTSFQHDAAGRVTGMTEAPGTSLERTFQFTEASTGLLASRTDPDGGVTRYTHDSQGLLTSVTTPGGATTRYANDGFGRLTAVTDANGGVTTYELAADGRLLKATDPLGFSFTYTYNSSGGLSSVTDGLGHKTVFTTDEFGRILSRTDPLGLTTRYERDSHGWVTKTTYPDGLMGTFSYDFEGRLLRADFSGGTSPPMTEMYTYGPSGNLLTFSNGSVALTWTYDVRGRVLSESSGLTGKTISYEYTTDVTERRNLGKIKKITDGDAVIEYEYDARNRVNRIRYATTNVIDLVYDTKDRIVRRQFPGGIATAYSHDLDGNVTSIVHQDAGGSVLLSRAYQYDALRNVLEAVDEGGKRTRYHYDAKSQLVRVDFPDGGAMSYAYDGVGNRLSMVNPSGVPVNYTYDANNRLLTDGTLTYSYDARGNLITKDGSAGPTSFTYDGRDRLLMVSLPGGEQVSYAYGIGSQRVVRTSVAGASRYSYVRDELFAEYDATNAVRNSYILGDPGYKTLDDGVGFRTSRGDLFSYLRDKAGSVIGLVSGSGALVATDAYDPFGQVTSETGVMPSDLRFQGRPLDPISGTMNFRFREYDPSVGRFLTTDPAGGVDRLSDYVFAGNNPQSYADPFGLFTVDPSCASADKQRLEACGQDVRNTVNNPPSKCFIGKELGRKLLTALDNATVGCYGATDAKCSGANAGVGAWGSVGGSNIWFCPTGLSFSYGGQSSLCAELMHELVHNTGEGNEDVAHGCERRCYEGRGGYPEQGGTKTCKDCK